MMKVFKYTVAVGLAIGLFAACKKSDSFLDKRQTESLTEQIVFADSVKTLNFLNDLYAYTGMDLIHNRYTLITSVVGNDYACMEDMTSHSVSYYGDPQASFITGASTSRNYFSNNYYKTYYTKIRAANQYLKKVGGSPLSAGLQQRTKAEARYLRAWYYAQLLRYYGGVMLVGDTIYSDLNAPIQYQRNSYKVCIDYIVSECDKAAVDLPSVVDQPPADYGRITSGMCLALKARMLITAASPLYNGQPITTDAALQPLICYSATYDVNVWKQAAAACKALIDQGFYSLYENNSPESRPGYGFWKLFLLRKNSEYIMPYMMGNNTNLEGAWFPKSRGGAGWSTPSQNLVDAFGMKNGKSTSDPASGYDARFPYDNRDPRFYNTIIYNQALVYNNSTKKMDPVDIYKTWQGTLTGDGLQNYSTKTGYYSRKMSNDSTGQYSTQSRVYPVIRYAEILLGNAEATNEISGPVAEVYDIVKRIRRRAGIEAGADNSYGLPAGLSQLEMRRIIRNEYEVEFAYEGHWYYDTRRWKTAETTENIPIQGMMVTREQNNSWSYQRITALNAVFLYPKMYFCPFPYDEVNKSSLLLQNPGW